MERVTYTTPTACGSTARCKDIKEMTHYEVTAGRPGGVGGTSDSS
jgi:hypothetical protein